MSDATTLEEAREQAARYIGFVAAKRVTVGNEIFEVPNPSLLDVDQQRRYDELQLSLEELDRWPDVKNEDGEVVRMGEPKVPHRKGGKLVDPYDLLLTIAVFGEERTKRFLDKGGRPSDVWLFWQEMNKRVADRRMADSKSAGSDRAVEAVPGAD